MLSLFIVSSDREFDSTDDDNSNAQNSLNSDSGSDLYHEETSSAKCKSGNLVRQPKKGFLNRVNLVLSRFFLSKI